MKHPMIEDFGPEECLAVKYNWGNWGTISLAQFIEARGNQFGLAVMFYNIVEWVAL